MTRLLHRRWVQLLLAVLALGLLAAGFAMWRLSEQVNLVGFLGRGGPTQAQVPRGFAIEPFAQGLDGPRFISFGPDGHLYVAERGAGRIVRLPDRDGDGEVDDIEIFAEELGAPHSLVAHDGDWFVGIPSGVVRLRDSDGDGRADENEVLIDDYPTGGHNTRTVLFLPDGRMVVSVGSSCNACFEEDPRRAAILVYDGPRATGESIYASGLRNAVGLALHPVTGDLWATNNGRDFLGDNRPPDSLWRVQEGEDYGWPRCHGGEIPDPVDGSPDSCAAVPSPDLKIQAHSAPLGLQFYDGDQFPPAYRGDLFIAYHGSWNRSVPTGYKVVHVPFEDGQPTGEISDFAHGWLDRESGSASGRPVGLAVGPDGSLFVSDDKGGVIYRIAYTRPD